jgi:hypothetical protein
MKLKNNWYLKFIVLAVLLRMLVMPFFFHPDIKTYSFQASFLQKGVWNIYSYLPEHKNELPLKEEFVYFPLTYFTLGTYQIIALPFLGPNFSNWLANANASAVDMIGVYRYLFILKLPYLVLDILTAIFLAKIVGDEAVKRKVFLYWLFNPFSIIIIYVFSNVDIFPVFLSVLSLYFTRKNKWWLAGLMLGLGAGFKAYPRNSFSWDYSSCNNLSLGIEQKTWNKRANTFLFGCNNCHLCNDSFSYSVVALADSIHCVNFGE